MARYQGILPSEGDGLTLRETLGETDAEKLRLGDTLGDSEILAEPEIEGLTLADLDILGLTLGDLLMLADCDIEGDTLALSEIEGETDGEAEGDTLALSHSRIMSSTRNAGLGLGEALTLPLGLRLADTLREGEILLLTDGETLGDGDIEGETLGDGDTDGDALADPDMDGLTDGLPRKRRTTS